MLERRGLHLVPTPEMDTQSLEAQPLERNLAQQSASVRLALLSGQDVRARRDLGMDNAELKRIQDKMDNLLGSAAEAAHALNTQQAGYDLAGLVRLQNEVLRLLMETNAQAVDRKAMVEKIQTKLRSVYAQKYGAQGAQGRANFKLPSLEGVIPVLDYITEKRREAGEVGKRLEFYVNERADVNYGVDLIEVESALDAKGATGATAVQLVQIKKDFANADVALVQSLHRQFLRDFTLAQAATMEQGVEALDVALPEWCTAEITSMRDKLDEDYLQFLLKDKTVKELQDALTNHILKLKTSNPPVSRWQSLGKSERAAFALQAIVPIIIDINKSLAEYNQKEQQDLQKMIKDVMVLVKSFDPSKKYQPLNIAINSVVWAPNGKVSKSLHGAVRQEAA